jgi:sugar phosphate isomerase/epimerase
MTTTPIPNAPEGDGFRAEPTCANVVYPYALCAYSLPHTLGYLPTHDGMPNPAPAPLSALVEAAVHLHLSGVEFPLAAVVPSFDGKFIQTSGANEALLEAVRVRGLTLIADYGSIVANDAAHLQAYLRTAASAGARTVRATLSHILCGDRRGIPDGWPAYFEALVQRLRQVLPLAEELGITLAVENHQDVTSADLIDLYTASGESRAFGVTLDTGNPLAVAEDPVAFAERIAPLIRHVHLKDYTLHLAPNGYRLARCAAGEGVIDFPAILRIVRGNGHALLPSVEVAAQAARTIPILDASWWEHHRPAQAQKLIEALRVVWAQGRAQELPYKTAWERGESSEAVVREEWEVVERSVAYFAGLPAL